MTDRLSVLVDGSGIAIVTIDVPGEPVNTFGPEASHELDAVLDRIGAESAIQAAVIRSGKPDSFMAGADINQFATIRTAADGEAMSAAAHDLLARVEHLPKPTVVAIHGPCLGLGLELSLACSYRIASNDPRTQLGLPEVQLGILPGAGGTVRLPRLIGARAALDLILAGKSERSAKALRLGLVDEVVPVSILDRVAVTAAIRLAREGPPRRPASRGLIGSLLDRTAVGRRLVYRGAHRQVMAKTGGHYPAPLAALEVVRIGLEHGPDEGYRAEARAFGQLAASDVSRELVRIFFATTALKKDDGIAPGTARAVLVRRLGVVGAGFMGAGIAGTAITTAKIEVRLKDATLERVGPGIKAALGILSGQLARRRITRYEHERQAALVTGAVDYRGFERAELVIEAVFEDLGVKRNVVAELEAVLAPEAVIASNTSTIPIGRIAADSRHPERILGMHFFSPVDRMPLVEVIPSAATGPAAIATAVRLGRGLGKTVIVVADSPGFWVNRILAPYLVEAGRLVAEGVPIEVIDRTMTDFGFPVGPIGLLDEVGLDVSAKAGAVMREAFGDRLAPAEAIGRMVAAGRIGRKAGQGFYLYHDGHRADPDPKAYETLGVKPLATADREQIERRLVYALVNEAAAARAEGVVRSNRDGDIGAIFGIGFPPFLGGPLRFIERQGPARVVEILTELATRHGERFTPAPALRSWPPAEPA